MRIVLCGDREECNDVMRLLRAEPTLAFRRLSFRQYTNYTEYVSDLKKNGGDIAYILQNGADGMEWVIATKAIDDALPIAWFSDDRSFGSQSYRLGVAYFSEKPFTAEGVVTALYRCCSVSNHALA